MKRRKPSGRICGNCARASRSDLCRRWCPVTAQNISYRSDAGPCRFYVLRQDKDGSER